MAESGPLLSSAPQFKKNHIKKGVDVVLPFFENNCARRNSLARAFRQAMIQDTAEVQIAPKDMQTLKELIAEKRVQIIDILIASTCLRDTETPRATAEAIYDEIENKFKSL